MNNEKLVNNYNIYELQKYESMGGTENNINIRYLLDR